MKSFRKTLIWTTPLIVGLAGLGLAGVWLARSRPGNGEPVSVSPARGPGPRRSPETGSTVPAAAKEVPPRKVPPTDVPKPAAPALPRSPREIAALQAEILNVTLDPDKRVDALRRLRYIGDEWKSPAILSSMSTLLASEGDEVPRMNICRLLRGADSPEFRQQLLISASGDLSPGVRQEAAHALRSVASDPIVQQVLKKALETERVSGVRAEIERTLFAGRR